MFAIKAVYNRSTKSYEVIRKEERDVQGAGPLTLLIHHGFFVFDGNAMALGLLVAGINGSNIKPLARAALIDHIMRDMGSNARVDFDSFPGSAIIAI